jgi:hypothetical protein
LRWLRRRSGGGPIDGRAGDDEVTRADDGPPFRGRFVVRSVARAGAVANLEPLAVVVALTFVLGPVLLFLLPIELVVMARFVRQGTYVSDDSLVLRGPFATRRLARADVDRFVVEDVYRGRTRTPSRAGVAVLRDGRRIRLPGLSSSRSEPREPDATVRALAAAARLDVSPSP